MENKALNRENWISSSFKQLTKHRPTSKTKLFTKSMAEFSFKILQLFGLLLEQARWSKCCVLIGHPNGQDITARDLPPFFRREIFICSVNWPCSSLLFLHFMYQNSVNKNTKNELGQYLVYIFYPHGWLTLFCGNDGFLKKLSNKLSRPWSYFLFDYW